MIDEQQTTRHTGEAQHDSRANLSTADALQAVLKEHGGNGDIRLYEEDEAVEGDEGLATPKNAERKNSDFRPENGDPKETPARDKTGKFAQAKTSGTTPERKAADKEIPAPTPKVEVQQKSDTPTANPDKVVTDAAPASWRKEAAAEWDKLTPGAKAEVSRLTQELTQAATQAQRESADIKRETAAMQDVLKPWNDTWRGQGKPVAMGLGQVVQTVEWAKRDPEGFVRWFIKETPGLEQKLKGESPAEYLDPHVRQLQQHVDSLTQGFQQFQTIAQQQQQQSGQRELETFAQSKTEQGQLKHPHFEKVVGKMLDLFPVVKRQMPQLSQQEQLAETYHLACQADPELRRQVATEAFTAQEANRQTEADKARTVELDRSRQAQARAISPAGESLGAPANGLDHLKGKSTGEILQALLTQGNRV